MSSRHEGVSCDACLKAYFRGRRYKCLICYDYDLCSTCYENGAATSQHTTDHPMQCILTRHDFDIFYGGEALSSDQPQSLTCPFCGKMGFTEVSLQEHATVSHTDTTFEVICPICATVSGGDPNHVTDDFAAHLTLGHRSGAPRDLDVTESVSRHVRRIPHQGRGLSRGVTRNMRFGSVNSGLFSSSSRDSMDPIAELLSQLSGVRRATASDPSPTATTQLEQAATRQQQITTRRGGSGTAANLPSGTSSAVSATQISVANIPDSSNGNISTGIVGSSESGSNQAGVVVNFGSSSSSNIVTSHQQATPAQVSSNSRTQGQQSQFLLARLNDMENEHENSTETRERASFVQELLLSTLSELSLSGSPGNGNLSIYTSKSGSRSSHSTQSGTQMPPPLPLTTDASTQTTNNTIASTPPTNNSISNPLSPLTPSTHPLSKTPSTNSLPHMKGTKMSSKSQLVTRPNSGLQPLSPQQQQQQSNGSNLGSNRVVTVTATGAVPVPPQMGGRGRATGGSVSPGATRRKPIRGVESRATQPPPPH